MANQSGFTLPELVVTVAVAAVLLGLAVPSFRETVIGNRLTSATNEFMAAINYARSEAIRRGQSVILCKTDTGTSCNEGGNKWEIGWMAFVDKDKDQKLTAGDEILRVWPALPEKYTLRLDPDANFDDYLRYDPHGAANSKDTNSKGTFAVCYDNQTVGAKAIDIKPLRPMLGIDTNGNRIPENDSGDIPSCFTL